MPIRIAIVACESTTHAPVAAALHGIDGIVVRTAPASQLGTVLQPAPAVAVLCFATEADLSALPQEIRRFSQCPILGVVPPALVSALGPLSTINDFAVAGASAAELRARVRRLANTWPSTEDAVARGDLLIDTVTCEVSLSGVLVELTFREYELLKFLATNPGRVFSRETLLNSVWGYDYYGGDRTVDVHVRRLRSKIEDANHTFIDTVRNMGYRFRKSA